MEIWKCIGNLPSCEPSTLAPPYQRLRLMQILEDGTRWLVGPYEELTEFAKNLRHQENLCGILTSKKVRLGLRKNDVPPLHLEQQKAYGEYVRGADHGMDFTASRARAVAVPFRADKPPVNRITDRNENVENFWRTQTPQSHHIVEFKHLEKLGVSNEKGNRESDYLLLPAVLLTAGFHQRYISSILKHTHRWSPDKLRAELARTYYGLYGPEGRCSSLFPPLWQISKIILDEVGIGTP